MSIYEDERGGVVVGRRGEGRGEKVGGVGGGWGLGSWKERIEGNEEGRGRDLDD